MKKQAKKKPVGKKKKQTRKNHVIVLQDQIGAVPTMLRAKKHKPKGPGDRVRWSNEAPRGVTLSFQTWPFVEPPQLIQIAAGRKSGWFTVYQGTVSTRYGYTVTPSLIPPGTPPDSPAVIVED